MKYYWLSSLGRGLIVRAYFVIVLLRFIEVMETTWIYIGSMAILVIA